VILESERAGHAAAAGCDHGKSRGGDGSRGRDIPRVRKEQGLARSMERTQRVAFVAKI
jgi:hypothetical protein